jgi:hypothetical protein
MLAVRWTPEQVRGDGVHAATDRATQLRSIDGHRCIRSDKGQENSPIPHIRAVHRAERDRAADATRRLIGAETPFVSYGSRGHWRK